MAACFWRAGTFRWKQRFESVDAVLEPQRATNAKALLMRAVGIIDAALQIAVWKALYL